MGPASPGLGARGALHSISPNGGAKIHIETQGRVFEAGGRRETSYLLGGPSSVISVSWIDRIEEGPDLAWALFAGLWWLCGREGCTHLCPGLGDLCCARETLNWGCGKKLILGFSTVIEK